MSVSSEFAQRSSIPQFMVVFVSPTKSVPSKSVTRPGAGGKKGLSQQLTISAEPLMEPADSEAWRLPCNHPDRPWPSWFIGQDSGRVPTGSLGEYLTQGVTRLGSSPDIDHHGPSLTTPRLLRPLGLPLHGPPITRGVHSGHVSSFPANMGYGPTGSIGQDSVRESTD
jgi:hypothetical protein